MAKYHVLIPGFERLQTVTVPQAERAEINDLGHLIFIDGNNAVAVFKEWVYSQEVPSND